MSPSYLFCVHEETRKGTERKTAEREAGGERDRANMNREGKKSQNRQIDRQVQCVRMKGKGKRREVYRDHKDGKTGLCSLVYHV